MNIDQYIASGVLESYVLGQLDERQEAEVRLMAEQYPEVRKELQEIEMALETYALKHAVTPPPALENRIAEQLFGEKSERKETPVKELIPEFKLDEEEAAANITPLYRRQGWLFGAAMAASILLLVSMVLNFNFYSRWKNSEMKVALLEQEKSVLAQQNEVQRTGLQSTQEQLLALSDPNVKMIPLGGTPLSPESKAVVCWNTQTAAVMIRPVSLPAPPAGKQYQLWAIVDGKPVDAGVFDLKTDSLQGMKEIKAPQAFAVTLEDAGGVPSPTLDQMYLIAKLD